MVIDSRHQQGVTRIELRGELDEAHNPQLRGALRLSIDAGEPDIVLDLCGVPYVSAGALRVLVGALKAQQGRGGTLRLAGPCAQVRDKLVQTQLIRVFAVEEAAAPKSPSGGSRQADRVASNQATSPASCRALFATAVLCGYAVLLRASRRLLGLLGALIVAHLRQQVLGVGL